MFTGIVAEVGSITALDRSSGGVRFAVHAPRTSADLNVGESVAVNGVCLTVTDRKNRSFVVEAVGETLRKTTMGDLTKGSKVNLELALRFNDRVGGHLVLGHVDTVGVVKGITEKASSRLVTVAMPDPFMKYVIPVGSIAIDGVSLTIAHVEENAVVVSLIPHTLEVTTLNSLDTGTRVNLEFDVIGKYVERLVVHRAGGASSMTAEDLRRWGYET